MNPTILILLILVLLPGTGGAEILSLRDCLSRAAKENPSLKVSALDEKHAAQTPVIARSGFLPRIDIQGGYTAQVDPQSIRFTTGSFATQQPEFPYFNLSLYQTLYDFGRTEARVRRAAAAREAVANEYGAREKDIFLDVVRAYYGVLESQKILRTATDEITQRKEHLRVARNLYDQGVVTRNDLLQAEVKLADSRQREMDAANRVNNGWLRLNFLMGQSPGYRAELKESPELEPDMPEGTLDQALANRPEMAALKKSVEARQAEVAESKTNFLPEVFARLGIDYVQNNKVQEQAIYYATVGVRVNLFEGFATAARQRQAVLSRSRAEEQLRLEEAQIRLELQVAQNDAQVAAERVKTIEHSIRQGEENLRINRDRYSEQVGTATEVLDAQTLLTQVKTEYFRAKYAFEVAKARITHALGKFEP